MNNSTPQSSSSKSQVSNWLMKRRKSLAMAMIGFGLLGVLSLGLLAVINLSQFSQDLSRQAAPTTTITAATSQTTVAVGQTFSVEVQVNTGTNVVKALDIGLKYNPEFLQLTEITKGTWMSLAEEAVKSIDQANGQSLLGLVIPRNASPAFVTGQGTAAVATFKALKVSNAAQISFEPTLTVAGAANEGQNVIASYNPLTVNLISDGTTPPSNDNFIVYSYEACLNQNSDGHSSYILWKPTTYAEVTTIDVSEHSDFSQSASKNVAGATSTLTTGYLLTDGTNFRVGGLTNGALFTFQPNVTYYFRLNYGTNLKSPVVAYKPASCAGTGGTAIKQCNESCSNNSECGANLVCHDSKCRRDGNVSDNKCVLPPDKGIHRGCNEYCADNNECGNGYTCWWNQCRNPRDLTNATCKVALKPGEVESCNQYCANDGECASGLKCWWNQCRLPSNLDNQACQPKPTAAPAQSKGSDTTTKASTTSAKTPTTAPKATVSARIKIVTSPSPSVATRSARATMAPTRAILPTEPPVQTKKAASSTSSFLNAIPVLLVIIFLALLAMLFGPQLMKSISGKNQPPPTPKV